MKPQQSAAWIVQLALCGALALLAGCPSAGTVGQGTPVAGAMVNNGVCHVPDNADQLVQEVFDLVNRERTSRGLNPLTMNPLLNQIAEDYACEMIEEGFFDHVNPFTGEGPGQRAINAGYVFLAIGENLAGGQTTPVQVMREWMASRQGHRENILSPQWSEIGIAVRTGGEHAVYWVQEFGNPP